MIISVNSKITRWSWQFKRWENQKKKLLRLFIRTRSSPHTMRTPVIFLSVFGGWSLVFGKTFFMTDEIKFKKWSLARSLLGSTKDHELWEHPLYFVSLWWLVLAFLFHTLGELCLSPVGLSYVSKLAPARLVGVMFGVWFGATAVANYLAGWTGSYIDDISGQIGLVGFFLIFTAIPIVIGLVLIAMGGWIKKMMHGIE